MWRNHPVRKFQGKGKIVKWHNWLLGTTTIVDEIEKENYNIKNAVHSSTHEAQRIEIKQKHFWITEELDKLIMKKKELHNRWLTKQSHDKREEWRKKGIEK